MRMTSVFLRTPPFRAKQEADTSNEERTTLPKLNHTQSAIVTFSGNIARPMKRSQSIPDAPITSARVVTHISLPPIDDKEALIEKIRQAAVTTHSAPKKMTAAKTAIDMIRSDCESIRTIDGPLQKKCNKLSKEDLSVLNWIGSKLADTFLKANYKEHERNLQARDITMTLAKNALVDEIKSLTDKIRAISSKWLEVLIKQTATDEKS